MANDALATGQVTVTANADPMVKGLKKAEADVKKSAHNMNQSIGKEFGQEASKSLGRTTAAGGFIGGLATGGILGGMADITVSAITTIIEKSVDLEKSLERVARQAEESAKALARSFKLADEMLSIPADREGQIAATESEIKRIDRELDERRDKIIDIQKQINAIRDPLDPTKWIGWAAGAAKPLEENIKGIRKEMGLLEDRRREQVQKEVRMRQPGELDPKLKTELNQRIETIEQEIRLWGLVGDERERALLIERKVTDEQIKRFDEVIAKRQALQAQDKMLGDFMSGLVGFGMDFVKDMSEKPIQEPKADRFAAAVEAGTKEAYSLSVRNQFAGLDGGASNVHKQNGTKLDVLNTTIRAGFKTMEDMLRGVGVL